MHKSVGLLLRLHRMDNLPVQFSDLSLVTEVISNLFKCSRMRFIDCSINYRVTMGGGPVGHTLM